MKVVSYPDELRKKLISKFNEMLKEGFVAEGEYYSAENDYIKNKKSVPVATWGAAYITLLAYYKNELGKKNVILQSNTMRGVYTSSRFMNMNVFVCDSSADPGFLSMDYNSLKKMFIKLEQNEDLRSFVLVYSIIGGFLSEDYFKIEKLCKDKNVPIIVDMAHGHYLDELIESEYPDLAFSFYATKILPTGEGGLIALSDKKKFEWIKKFLIYDRFDYSLEVGVNLRTNELTSYFIYHLMNDSSLKNYYRDKRVLISNKYRQECVDKEIKFLDYKDASDYNGYKFVIFDSFEEVSKKSDLLSKNGQTSPVFNFDIINKKPILNHWCPPTYPSITI
ncbi:DegT/DnrJ/EryC1/StrS family aminotransferase [Candidatus Marinimicrobia bacterium]|nr:DegT/DnrJ/EryC1/StrS family aminotransferase [Candidatus Neomarinimicrobiota bacterium]